MSKFSATTYIRPLNSPGQKVVKNKHVNCTAQTSAANTFATGVLISLEFSFITRLRDNCKKETLNIVVVILELELLLRLTLLVLIHSFHTEK